MVFLSAVLLVFGSISATVSCSDFRGNKCALVSVVHSRFVHAHHSRLCTSGQTAAEMSRLVVSRARRGGGGVVVVIPLNRLGFLP